MKKRIERKTAFLYPAFSELDRETVLITNDLITNVNLVVRAANDSIKSILSQGGFSFINCFPTVSMKPISEESTAHVDSNNVRICILKYNDIDYSENYELLINDYKNGRSDISHLVAVSIQDRDQKVKFEVDPLGHFDVIVKSNIDRLKQVLIAIMLDISLYHYFLQSNSLNDRKDFNKVKIDYISNFLKEDIYNSYGVMGDEKLPSYLPISWKYTTKFERYKTKDSRREHILSLIDFYASFLVNSIAYEVVFNEHGRIADNPNNETIKNLDVVQNFITKKYIDGEAQKISFIIPDNATEIDQIIMIEYCKDDPNWVHSWMNKELEDIGSYQIITAIERI